MSDDISILSYLATIEDPRIVRAKRHKLIDILTIAVCAAIANADG